MNNTDVEALIHDRQDVASTHFTNPRGDEHEGETMLNEPQVLAAFITGIAGIVAALIASLTGALIGRKFLNQRKLQANLDRAIKDIRFLLEVERCHCDRNKDMGEASNLRTVRKYVEKELGETWSGRFTPGREGRRLNA